MTDLELAALAVLRSVITTVGKTIVQGVLNDLLGSGTGYILSDASSFVAGVLRAVIEVLGEGAVRAEVEAMFNAADVAAEAAETAKFGPR